MKKQVWGIVRGPDSQVTGGWPRFRAQVLPDPKSSEKFLIPTLQNRSETANLTGHLALLRVQPESWPLDHRWSGSLEVMIQGRFWKITSRRQWGNEVPWMEDDGWQGRGSLPWPIYISYFPWKNKSDYNSSGIIFLVDQIFTKYPHWGPALWRFGDLGGSDHAWMVLIVQKERPWEPAQMRTTVLESLTLGFSEHMDETKERSH